VIEPGTVLACHVYVSQSVEPV